MHPANDWLTVDLTGKQAMRSYLFSYNGKACYNLYNLLKGDDDWDPMQLQPLVEEVEKADGTTYSGLPTHLFVTPWKADIETEVSDTVLTALLARFGDYPSPISKIQWHVAPEYSNAVCLVPSDDGTCKVIGTNTDDETKRVVVTATSEEGLESAAILTVRPKTLPAPDFIQQPQLEITNENTAVVHYELDLNGRKDESLVTWYRCTDAQGSNPFEVAVSRLNTPETTYRLTSGDAGYYLMVSVAPKHLRSEAGAPHTVVTPQPIRTEETEPSSQLYTDFRNFPTALQPRILKGFWTVDAYKPMDTSTFDWPVVQSGCWFYGKGNNGASRHYGLLQGQKGARLLYTPTGDGYGDMRLTLKVDPAKTAGQGFGSATGQYMDVCIKFDTQTLTGYALRIIRTPKNDSAVDFYLVQYDNGQTTAISEAVSASCYLSTCTITLSCESGKLSAHVESDAKREAREGILSLVNLEADVTPNAFGGIGIQHTGSTGDSATQLRSLRVEWESDKRMK